MDLTITNSADISRRLQLGEVDIGFVGSIPTDAVRLQARPFAEDDIVLIVPPGHGLVNQRSYSSAIFERETLVVRERGSGTRQMIETEMGRLGLKPARVMELSGCDTVKRVVEAGLGLAFVSRRTVALEITCGLVHIPEIVELHFQRQLYVLTRKDARPSAAVLSFLALVVKKENATQVNLRAMTTEAR